MVQKIVKVFPQETQLVDMQTVDGTVGYELSDIINSDQYETYVEETLYTSLNQIRFYYPITGIHFQYLKNGNHILYPTPTGYNLYTIDNLSITTDEEVLQVDAQHYSVNYMRDSAHGLAIGRNAATISNINTTLTRSVYVSDDFNLVGEGTASGAYTLKDDSYNSSLSTATVGSVLVGANSVLRRYYDQYLRRNLDHLEAFKVNPFTGEVQSYPIVLGINVRDMDYSIDTSDIYTTAMLSSTTVPDLRIPGGDSVGGRYSGLGGSIWFSLTGIPEGLTMLAIYKGLPIEITKSGGNISVEIGKIVSNTDDTRLADPITDAIATYSSNSLVISRGDTVYLNESINPGYLYAITVQNKATNTDYTYQYLGKNKFIGKQGYTYTTKIPAHTFQYPLRATTTHKGNSVKYVDYEPFEATGEPEEVEGATEFYHWHLYKFTSYWDEFESQKLLEPTFEAKFTIDDMRTLYGQDVINSHIFRVGDLYKVDAQDYGLQFNAAITKTKYNGLTGEVIEIEFGNRQDTQLEELKATNINKPTERKQNNTTSPSYTSRPTQSSGGGGGFSKDDADEWIKDAIKDGDFDDEIGSWLDIVLNGDDIRDDRELFEGNMPYEKRTDDTGIPKMVWEPPYVTISPDGSESTHTKLICYNGAEAVIGEVVFKGEHGNVNVNQKGEFTSGRDFLPNNEGFQLVPHPIPDFTGGFGTWAWNPVFSLGTYEKFNKDMEHGVTPYRESDVSLVDFNTAKETLGQKYSLAVNATTKGTVILESERINLQRQVMAATRSAGVYPYILSDKHTYQLTNIKDFKEQVIDVLVGKTIKQGSYNTNLPNEQQSLNHYLIQSDNGEVPNIIAPYRRILDHFVGRLGRSSGSPEVFFDAITVNYEVMYDQEGVQLTRQITSVDFDEGVLEEFEYNKLINEEPAWSRIIFTQPTTKVNDQTVRVNHLLITNGGTTTKNALISKHTVDLLWTLLSPAERKEFEDTYGKEWLFNLKNTPGQYDSDDVLFGAFYRSKNKIKPPGAFDPFGLNARLIKQDEARAVKVSERYQQKYNFLVNKGYTVPPSKSGQAIYDRVEKHYLEQAPIE